MILFKDLTSYLSSGSNRKDFYESNIKNIKVITLVVNAREPLKVGIVLAVL